MVRVAVPPSSSPNCAFALHFRVSGSHLWCAYAPSRSAGTSEQHPPILEPNPALWKYAIHFRLETDTADCSLAFTPRSKGAFAAFKACPGHVELLPVVVFGAYIPNTAQFLDLPSIAPSRTSLRSWSSLNFPQSTWTLCRSRSCHATHIPFRPLASVGRRRTSGQP